MNLLNKWIEIQGYKHDGRMHRIWDNVFVVEETEEYIVVASTKTKVIEHDFRVWYTKEPAIMIFFKKLPFFIATKEIVKMSKIKVFLLLKSEIVNK